MPWAIDEPVMRIVREYFGLDRTTVVYDNEISGVGGTADEFLRRGGGRHGSQYRVSAHDGHVLAR